jgi:hypothetical protein
LNNLKQWGIGLHNYHDSYKVFPPALLNAGRQTCSGVRRDWDSSQMVLNTTGWALLLPFVEQKPLWDSYDFHACSTSSNPRGCRGLAGTPAVNAPWYGTRLDILECPSADTVGQRVSYQPTGTHHYSMNNAWRVNYLFSTGIFHDSSRDYDVYTGDIRRGMFGNNGAARLAVVKDGTSNSIAIGEAVGYPHKTSSRYGPWGLVGCHTSVHGRVYSNRSTRPIAITNLLQGRRYAINADYVSTAGSVNVGRSYAWVFNSLHPGGAQFVLGDGSGRFFSETIDLMTWCRLAYINDGEPVTVP